MGTTTTPFLGLTKPDKLEDMTNWPAQYEANMDKLDAIFFAEDPVDFTPAFTASTTNPTLGTGGYVQGKLIRIWKKLVVVKIRMYAGSSGFNQGSGDWRFSMPIPHDLSLPVDNSSLARRLGHGYCHDASSSGSAQICTVTHSGGLFFLQTEAGASPDDVGSGSPFVWTNEDKLTFMAMYVGDI